MDSGYKILKSRSNLLGSILLCCAAFSSIITLERPDYNLFLFIFIAYTMFWKQNELKPGNKIISLERMLFTLILSVSLLVDLIWILTHSNISSSFIIYLSWIEFFVKILVVGVVFVMWQGFKREIPVQEIEGTEFGQLDEE